MDSEDMCFQHLQDGVQNPIKAKQPLKNKIKELCTKLTEGEPEIFELPRQKIFTDTKNRIVFVEIGRPGPKTVPSGPRKVLLIIGETGVGKTTLIDGLANHIFGVQWEDNFRFKLTKEKTSSQAKSQTSWITVYTFQTDDYDLPCDITLIDTPGLGDTKGMTRDKEITVQLRELLLKHGSAHIDQINGIGFVIKSSDFRLTIQQKYIFDAVLSQFGSDVAKSIIFLCTFADNNKPPAVDALSELGLPINAEESYLKFNNCALFEKKDHMQHFWKMQSKNYENLLSYLSKAEGKSLSLTRELLEEQQQLEEIVDHLLMKFKVGIKGLDDLHVEEKSLQSHEAVLSSCSNYLFDVALDKQKRLDLPVGLYVTNCLVCQCTCHFPCTISKDEDKGSCDAMDSKSGCCTICPNQCIWSKHVCNQYWFVEYKEIKTVTSAEKKVQYDLAQREQVYAKTAATDLSMNVKRTMAIAQDMIPRARAIIESIKKKALKTNPFSEAEYIALLMEVEKREAKFGWELRLESLGNFKRKAEFIRCLINDPTFKGFEEKDPLTIEKHLGSDMFQSSRKKIEQTLTLRLPKSEGPA